MGIDSLSQRQRFWLFVTLTTVTLVGYSLLSRFLAKDPKVEQAKATEVAKGTELAKNDKDPKATAPAGKNEVPAKKDQAKEPVKDAEPVVDRFDALNKLLASRGEEKQHVLGDNTSKLRVVFSDRGGIRSMTLNDHEASDRQTGRRLEPNASGQPPRLTLVTDDEDIFDPKKQRIFLPAARQFELLSYRLAVFNDKDQIPAELAALPWKQLEGATTEKLSYVAEVPSKNLKITRNFTLEKDTYHVSMELQFAPLDATKPTQFTYELSGPQGLPVEGLRWKQVSFRNYVFVTQDAEKTTNLNRTLEGIEKLNKDGTPRNYTLNETKGKQVFLYGGVMIQFFASLAIVDHSKEESPPFLIDRVLAEFVGPDHDAPEFYKDRQGRMTTKLVSTPVTLEKGQTVSHKYLLYAGPSKAMLLQFEKGVQPNLYSKYADQFHLDQLTDATDFPNGPFQSLKITALLVKSTNMMHFLLEWLHSVVRNYGIAIIFMTVLVRLCLFPLSRKQAQNQAKMQEQMKVIRPEMEKIKKQYANDRQAYAAAQMELFKKHKMSPLAGCNGCWILFLQMPVFLGLYFALRESIHLRLSGFLWIENLAMPDMLLHWGDNFMTNLPISFLYLGPYLHILPIISVSVMYMYQKLMAPPAMDEQQEQQIKMMNYMTLVMGLAFYWVASGLCLYFIVSSLWGMVERKFTKKAKEQAVAQWQEKREKGNDKNKSDEDKPAGGVRGKLGDMWRDLQNRADKRT